MMELNLIHLVAFFGLTALVIVMYKYNKKLDANDYNPDIKREYK